MLLAVEHRGAGPHRGQGIAKRLKAEMWQWLRDDEPQITGLRTGNAHSNAAMLAINDERGFRPVHPMCIWQAPLHTLASALRPRTVFNRPMRIRR